MRSTRASPLLERASGSLVSSRLSFFFMSTYHSSKKFSFISRNRAVPVQLERNQRVAMESLRREFTGHVEDLGLVLFTMFDDSWKVDREGTFRAGKFWGIRR